MSTHAIDAVSLSIMWDRLVGITDEIISALIRSSFSTIVRESGDLSVVVLDAQGNSIAQGSYSVPSFTGTAATTLRHMLAKFPPDSLEPGDVVATNDAWMGTGHLFDINVMRPVFRNGRIAGYTLSITHLPDIGGLGFGAAATEIYHEGLRLPICKLVRAGRLDEPMFDVIRTNVRVPEQVFGDLMANITCNEVGARQLLEFMDEYALDDLAPLSAAIRGQSERAIRDRIAALPDGIYEGTLDIEGIDDALRLVCRAEVDGGGIALDFAGTSPPVDRGINVPLCYTRAMACYAVKCLTVPGMPNNEGAVAPIRIEDIPVPAVALGVAGPPQVARAGIIEERRRGGADVLSPVRGALCSVTGREPAFAELDLDEDQARTTVVVLHVDRHVAGGVLLVIGRLRPRALCQHVRWPLELELDVNGSDG